MGCSHSLVLFSDIRGAFNCYIPTGANGRVTNGRNQKGPDGNYHVNWFNDILWGNLGFFNDDYWGDGGGRGGGGGGGGGGSYHNIMGMSSSSILSQMGFGQSFKQNKNGDYGFTGGVVTVDMVQSYYQQLWSSTHSERVNISAKDAQGANYGLGFGVGWSISTSNFSVVVGSMFLSNEKAQGLFFAYTNISALVVNAGVNGIMDVGHTATQIGSNVYGYYPTTENVFKSDGIMKVTTRAVFDNKYKPEGYKDFTLKVTQAQANLVAANLNNYLCNPGTYSILGTQCTSVSCSSIINAGVGLQDYNFYSKFPGPTAINTWGLSPGAFGRILQLSINSTIVTGNQYFGP